MIKVSFQNISAFLTLLFILLGTTTFVCADKISDVKLVVEDIKFKSSVKFWYWPFETSGFVTGHPGELIIKLINKGNIPSPNSEIYADLKYTFPRTDTSGAVNPPQYLEHRYTLKRDKLPPINPSQPLIIKLKTIPITFEETGVDKFIVLHILIRDLSQDNNVLYENNFTYQVATESEMEDKKRGEVIFFFVIASFIATLFNTYISLRKKRATNFEHNNMEVIQTENKIKMDEKSDHNSIDEPRDYMQDKKDV